MKKAALHNLGCKVNAYETEAMQQQLEKAGYEIVDFKEIADVYIINTCTVTNIADRKSRQMLHRAKKINPQATVVAVGCYAQAAVQDLEKDLAVDVIIGNNKKIDLIKIIEAHQNEIQILDINQEREYEGLEICRSTNHVRANIKVQDGCNQFCSYCIIPYTRGRVRSRAVEDVVKEISNVVTSGCSEVVLTGIHTASYGVDFQKKTTLLDLIIRIHEIPGLKRIRLSSLEQGIITEEFISALRKLEKVCPHFHLSLQSGCDETLKRMNRKYTTDEFYEKIQLIRKYYDMPGITTDIIVGFPGETQEEFKDSLAFVKKAKFSGVHVFKYSVRKGTQAAGMINQVSTRDKNNRSDEMIQVAKELKEEFQKNIFGRKSSVLFEEPVVINGKTYQGGHTMEYIQIAVVSKEDLSGKICEVIPIGTLNGEILLAEKPDIY